MTTRPSSEGIATTEPGSGPVSASWYQDRVFTNLPCKRPQLDEVWGFVGAKAKNANPALRAAGEQGDAWLWLATCADTKLVPSWLVGGRDSDTAIIFTDDLQQRLANRVQVTSDGHKAYLDAIATSFGGDVDYAMLVKMYGPPQSIHSAAIAPQSASARGRNGLKATPIRTTSARLTRKGTT